ncbi:hypothetical protein ACWF9B_00630 [Streptomyces sp. NPDC055089]
MNWAELLDALLFAATITPMVLWSLDMMSNTETLTMLTGAFATGTVCAFLQDAPGQVAWHASLTIGVLALLRHERAARKTTKSHA